MGDCSACEGGISDPLGAGFRGSYEHVGAGSQPQVFERSVSALSVELVL